MPSVQRTGRPLPGHYTPSPVLEQPQRGPATSAPKGRHRPRQPPTGASPIVVISESVPPVKSWSFSSGGFAERSRAEAQATRIRPTRAGRETLPPPAPTALPGGGPPPPPVITPCVHRSLHRLTVSRNPWPVRFVRVISTPWSCGMSIFKGYVAFIPRASLRTPQGAHDNVALIALLTRPPGPLAPGTPLLYAPSNTSLPLSTEPPPRSPSDAPDAPAPGYTPG